MFLQSFRARGFKNFQQEVRLDDLRAINVVHGANNVGKSNLLEAMGLFFALLDEIVQSASAAARSRMASRYPGERAAPDTPGEIKTALRLDPALLEQRGYRSSDIFNKARPVAIELKAHFLIEDRECEQAGVKPVERVAITLELVQRHNLVLEVDLKHFLVKDGVDLLAHLERGDAGASDTILQVCELIVWTRRGDDLVSRYATIQVDRSKRALSRTSRIRMGDDVRSVRSDRALIPDDLWLALYDDRESSDQSMNRRWELFLASLERFGALVGEGTFDVQYSRASERAALVFKGADGATIRADLLGSGVQQVAGLVGRLLTSGASFLSLEEPELNLSYKEQHALREALDALVAHELGPSQLFITSHSAAFEARSHFYAMSRTEDGPVVEKRGSDEAIAYTQHDLIAPRIGASAPLCYITSEGLVEVPDAVRRAMSGGDGVRFVRNKKTGRYELFSTEDYLSTFFEDDPAPDDGDDDDRG